MGRDFSILIRIVKNERFLNPPEPYSKIGSTAQLCGSHRNPRGFYHVSASARHHLSVLHQFGTAGFPARFRVADHVSPARRAGFLRRNHFHDHCLGNHRFQPAKRPADPAAGYREGHGHQCRHDRRSALGIFRQQRFLAALPVGGSLRAGRGKRGRFSE